MLCVLWRFERLSSIRRYPICVLLMNLMLAVQSINFACTDFLEFVLCANGRWNPTVRSLCGHGFLTQPELASQSVSTLEKLLGNRFCQHGKKRTEKNGKKCTERYRIPNFHRFRKSLATSTHRKSTQPPSWILRSKTYYLARSSIK